MVKSRQPRIIVRCTDEEKEIIDAAADAEKRSVSNYLIWAGVVYARERLGIDIDRKARPQ